MTVARATVNPTESHVIQRTALLDLGSWPLPLSVESAREILALADKWSVRGPNGPARSIQLHGVDWASVWRAIDGGAS